MKERLTKGRISCLTLLLDSSEPGGLAEPVRPTEPVRDPDPVITLVEMNVFLPVTIITQRFR